MPCFCKEPRHCSYPGQCRPPRNQPHSLLFFSMNAVNNEQYNSELPRDYRNRVFLKFLNECFDCCNRTNCCFGANSHCQETPPLKRKKLD